VSAASHATVQPLHDCTGFDGAPFVSPSVVGVRSLEWEDDHDEETSFGKEGSYTRG
jgi:hypothetical protein